MPGSTPVYSFPYQVIGDPPHGPDLGEDLATAVENTIETIDLSRISTVVTQVFNANGTWTKPDGALYVHVRCQAGGGAGGGPNTTPAGESACGTGGQGGAYAESLLSAGSLASTVAVTRGAGGTGVNAAAGNAGGTSSFGSHVSAAGGDGGVLVASSTTVNANSAPQGTQSMTGQIQIKGSGGGAGQRYLATRAIGGHGGIAYMGGGAAAQNLGDGFAGCGYGGGGGGGSNGASASSRPGGAGANGVVIVTSYCV